MTLDTDNNSEIIVLPEVLGADEAQALYSTILPKVNISEINLDGSQVRQVSSVGLQVLISLMHTLKNGEEKKLNFTGMSDYLGNIMKELSLFDKLIKG